MNLTLNVGSLVNTMPLDQVIQLSKQSGFDSADYSLECMIDPACHYHGPDALKIAESIGAQMRQGDFPIRQTHAPFSFKNIKDQAVFDNFIYPAIVRSIEVSAALGAKITVVHPLHHMVYEGHEEELFEMNMKFYRSLIPVCQSCGIKVALENMFQTDPRRKHITHDTCSDPYEFCRYVDTLNSEYMVACLDVGHIGLVPQRIEAWDAIRILGHDRLQALHIHDNDYKADLHILPYTGMLNWDEITRALGEIDYAGDFTYEVSVSKFTNTMDESFFPIALRYMGDVGRHLVELVDRNRPKMP